MESIGQVLDKVLQFTFRFFMFLSSYIPLFIIIFLKNISNLHICIIVVTFFIMMPLLVIRKYISNPLRQEANNAIIISSINKKDSEILNYISGYIIPLVAFNSDVVTKDGISIPNLLGVMVLFAVICSLYMKAEMYYINPILNIFYEISLATTDKKESIIIITDRNEKIVTNKTIMVRRISPGIFLVTKRRKSKISIVKILIFLIVLLILLFIWNSTFRGFVHWWFSKFLKALMH